VENETFNTLKNQGYHLEHNDGHGQQNLSVVLTMLMMLAFSVDQTSQLCSSPPGQRPDPRTSPAAPQSVAAAPDWRDVMALRSHKQIAFREPLMGGAPWSWEFWGKLTPKPLGFGPHCRPSAGIASIDSARVWVLVGDGGLEPSTSAL
jgi:hypothetical protein